MDHVKKGIVAEADCSTGYWPNAVRGFEPKVSEAGVVGTRSFLRLMM